MPKKYIEYILLILLFLSFINCQSEIDTNNNETKRGIINNEIIIQDIKVNEPVFQEWQHPGEFSPVNLFDLNIDTHLVTEDLFVIRIKLKKAIKFNNFSIINGLANKSFKLNERIKDLRFFIYQNGENNSSTIVQSNFILKDTNIPQKIKFNQTYYSKRISILCLSVYRGSKYEKIYIPELKFYYNDNEIVVKNISEYKKEYVNNIGKRLTAYLSNKKYMFCERGPLFETFSNGTIKLHPEYHSKFKTIKTHHWKVEENRFYLDLYGRMQIVKYYLADKILILDKIGNQKVECNLYPLALPRFLGHEVKQLFLI